jgi:hypothetical protein
MTILDDNGDRYDGNGNCDSAADDNGDRDADGCDDTNDNRNSTGNDGGGSDILRPVRLAYQPPASSTFPS